MPATPILPEGVYEPANISQMTIEDITKEILRNNSQPVIMRKRFSTEAQDYLRTYRYTLARKPRLNLSIRRVGRTLLFYLTDPKKICVFTDEETIVQGAPENLEETPVSGAAGLSINRIDYCGEEEEDDDYGYDYDYEP